MPSLIKASPGLMQGNYALVGYSVTQTAELTLTIDADFVGLPRATNDIFKLGSPLPSILRNDAELLKTLSSYGAKKVPTMTDCQIEQSNGLKTISARYTTTIAPTTPLSGTISISIDENGQVILSTTDGSTSSSSGVGTVDGAGSNGITGEVLSAVVSPGTQLQEVTVSTNWQSLSASAQDQAGTNYSFSFDYLSATVSVAYSGGLIGGGQQGGVGGIVNLRGVIPFGVKVIGATRDTKRSYYNSRGEFRQEFTSAGYYYVEGA